ncbi:unnamed protein product [Effrenium voratum]|uniref:TIR domain-containing protein n=1 Tax=Effrenium voratum TaxID=2562239 RepID=A0AA36HY86_9DINO|nr:unnamed protein product [Effrenium voratum]
MQMPECYFYGLLLFSRNTLVALIPLMFIGFPSFQVLLMGCLFLASTVLQIRTWPWRTWGANWSDTFVLAFLQVVLLAVSPLLEMDQERSARVMGWLMTSAVMLCLSAGVGSSLIVLLKRWYNRAAYGLFLCHHKRGAGSFCRLIKVLAAQNSAATVFLDSDHLEDLDLLFDIVRCQTRTLVVVLSGDVLRRMWCAGEIATANKNKVRTVMLKCEDSQQLSEELIRDIPSSWRQAERQTLSSYGISMEDIQEAYRTLRDLPSVQMRRFGRPQERREKVIELLRVSQVTRNMLTGSGEMEMKKQRARILVTGSVMDAEALAACEVFQVLVQQHIQVECAMVTKRGELMARRPWARYLAVLLSGDILTDPGFARILLADAECEKPLEMVTICADADFAFPNSVFYKELEQQGFVAAGISPSEGCALVKAWKSLCQVLALPLTPQGSERILGEQVVEICRRFRHYQDALKGHGQDSMMDLSVVPQDVDVEEDGWKSVLPVQVTRSDSDPDSPYQSRVSVLRKSNFILPSRLSL